LTPTEKQAVLKRQKYQCAICHEADIPLEFDHIIPVAAGGDNGIENVQALCRADHLAKTEQKRHTHERAWYSHYNRDTLEGLVDAPIPRQLVFGNGIPAIELDVVACKRWAIQKAERLPVADFLDRVDVFEPSQLANADFAFIDAGSPDLFDRQNFAAYAGPRWYGRDLTPSGSQGGGSRMGQGATTDRITRISWRHLRLPDI